MKNDSLAIYGNLYSAQQKGAVSYISSFVTSGPLMLFIDHRISFLFLLTFILFAHSQLTAQEVERRRSGDLAVGISAGVVNGARAGVTGFVYDRLSLDAALGVLSVQLIEEGGSKAHTSGYSATIGGTWFTLRDDIVSPFISLQGCYVYADAARIDQQRMIAILAVGTEYAPSALFSIYLRFGPAYQMIWTRGSRTTETTTQFDAGIGITL